MGARRCRKSPAEDTGSLRVRLRGQPRCEIAILVHLSRHVTETGRANTGVSTLWRVFDVGGVRTIIPDHSEGHAFSSTYVVTDPAAYLDPVLRRLPSYHLSRPHRRLRPKACRRPVGE
jgi:hypothetical protein